MRAVVRDIERPPNGWQYTVPETNCTIKAEFFEQLWKRILAHRNANNLPIPEAYREFIEDAACAQSNLGGTHCGTRRPRSTDKPIQHLLLSHVERFLKTVWQAILDRKFVTPEEAARRVSVCAGCPLRTTMPGGCTGCFTLIKKADAILKRTGAVVIPADGDGFVRDVCGACGCFIPLKVALENSTLDRAEGGSRPAYWEGCWRNGG